MRPTLLPALNFRQDLEPRLTELAVERMLQPADRLGCKLDLVGCTVLPQNQEIHLSEQGNWLFAHPQHDPSASRYGGRVPIPAAQREHLTTLSRAGVRPDHVWIAHELPADFERTDIAERLVPAPQRLRKRDDVLLRRARNFLALSKDAVGAAASLPALALGAFVGLDPVVLGGVQHPTEDAVLWAILAQWEWD